MIGDVEHLFMCLLAMCVYLCSCYMVNQGNLEGIGVNNHILFSIYIPASFKNPFLIKKYSFEDAGPPNSQMVSEPGKNVTLTCQPKEKCLLEEVSWEKIQPQQIDVLISCNLSHGKTYTSKYPRQILSNCSHGMKKTFVTIPNVTGSDSGLYRCGFKASTGEKETFVMRLTVTDGERRRQQQRGPFKDFWITQNRAANNYRNTFPANPPSDGAGEDIYVNHPTFSRVPRARV
ncbi:hypothetical protein FD754_005159 [Muntiacus muntjak]|uniref:Ig-like domain-containing protein n=1 Tax=Muntiacus muntjak TaxID=9888 RepID=A0A5N3WHP3_MUNMU|nr:hypothetical protein FD754_005159 [Muntiacus muntjak]